MVSHRSINNEGPVLFEKYTTIEFFEQNEFGRTTVVDGRYIQLVCQAAFDDFRPICL